MALQPTQKAPPMKDEEEPIDDEQALADEETADESTGEQPADQPKNGAAQISPRAANVFQRLFLAAKKIIVAKEVTSQLMELIKKAGPVDGVVQATMLVLDMIRSKVKGVRPEAVYSGSLAAQVALQIASIAVKAGLMEDDLKKYAQPVLQALKQQIASRMGGAQPGPTRSPAQAMPEQPPEQPMPEEQSGLLTSAAG